MGEKSEDVQQQQITTDDDYQTELPAKSVSAGAAQAGEAAAADGQPSEFRLPAIAISSEHAQEKEEWFRAQAAEYERAHKRTDTAAFRNLTDQAAAYHADADNLQAADGAYNQLVPQASFALDSVIRFKTIQDQLGYQYSDSESLTVDADSLGATVADRRPELAGAMSAGDIKTNKGQVTDAAKAFEAAQSEMYSSLAQMSGMEIHAVIKQLRAEQSEAKEKKENIERAIESAQSLFEMVSGALTFGGEIASVPHRLKSEEQSERREGGLAAVTSATEIAGAAVSAGMRMLREGDLNRLQTQIDKLGGELEANQTSEAAKQVEAIKEHFNFARQNYVAALSRYENAMASRRTAYAKAGSTTDKLHGADTKHGGDKASQTMLFISAARETDVILTTALRPAQHASDRLHHALHGMDHRSRGYLVDDWQLVGGEGSGAPDRAAALKAYGLTEKWIDATHTEVAAFDKIETASAQMLRSVGKTSGKY